jgi:hypothetical protein
MSSTGASLVGVGRPLFSGRQLIVLLLRFAYLDQSFLRKNILDEETLGIDRKDDPDVAS